MSWLARINNIPLQITTGDGQVYNPIFKLSSDMTPMNESVFEFIDKEGGLVRRGDIGVKQFNVEFHFLGENAIDIVEQFEISATDKRPWTLTHPYYGNILVQPTALNFMRSDIHDLVFRTTLFETISDILPLDVIDVQSDVLEAIGTVITESIENAREVNQTITQRFIDNLRSAAITDEDYQNVISYGNSALNNIENVGAFMRSTSNLLRAPSRFYASVSTRIDLMIESFNELLTIVTSNINYFENAGALVISGICESSVILGNEVAEEQDLDALGSDYRTRANVISVINQINSISSQYFTLIGENQSESYIPNYELIRSLFDLIGKTIGQLYIFAQDALQERSYTLPQDLPIVVLYHRLYGNISNIEEFAEYNNLSIDELLIIPQGKEISYFV